MLISSIIDLSNNFTSIDQKYGSLEDLTQFVNYSHTKNIKILMDFTASYTSNKNPWFLMSKIDHNYKDFYIWSDKPNNLVYEFNFQQLI